MSATSAQKKSSSTKSSAVTDGDRLRMLQAALNNVEEIAGVKVAAMTIFHEGQRVAAIAIPGCIWDDAGNLVLNAGNAGSGGE